jgi:hypothetical protein
MILALEMVPLTHEVDDVVYRLRINGVTVVSGTVRNAEVQDGWPELLQRVVLALVEREAQT